MLFVCQLLLNSFNTCTTTISTTVHHKHLCFQAFFSNVGLEGFDFKNTFGMKWQWLGKWLGTDNPFVGRVTYALVIR